MGDARVLALRAGIPPGEADEVLGRAEGATLPLLTATRLRTFRDCARKHQLAYVDGWRPVRVAEVLRFGSLVHVALEAYWRSLQEGAAHTVPLVAAYVALDEAEADVFDRVRAQEMLRVYSERWQDDAQAYEVLEVEQRFETPLVNPETCAPSKSWRYAGKIDAIVRRRSDQRVLVVEHKTTGEDVSSDDADYWARLGMDPQISEYVIGAESLGYEVDEVLYDVLARPTQRPYRATAPEARKYRQRKSADEQQWQPDDPRLLYANQRAEDETPQEYGARIRAAIEEAPSRFTARRGIPRMESQIADFMADAWQQAGVMRDSIRLGRAARNPDACDRFGRCPYFSLCTTGARPEEYPGEFLRVERLHPELEG